jgi:hypothetical protein
MAKDNLARQEKVKLLLDHGANVDIRGDTAAAHGTIRSYEEHRGHSKLFM